MEERADIDHLLERYLHLLHEYTSLRAELNKLQAGLYQNLARANFAAERGMRYGQDQYDDRMQASRRVVAFPSSSSPACATFEVVKVEESGTADAAEASVSKSNEAVVSEVQSTRREEDGDKEEEVKDSLAEETKPKSLEPKAKKTKDPLRWFGLITPMPLRQAQAQGVRAVEDIVPKLVSINAEMVQVEIEVRRARKKRAKAEAAAKKSEDVTSKEEVTI
ncbi:uncharacterized protein PG986_008254 [Apiospora aurea]|uniref:Vacuolar ATPase assembly protein VMA22 n=1 Tax=Apiospora aurea TaxID=335848 RepID=A0ABR1QEW4_9PEZI